MVVLKKIKRKGVESDERKKNNESGFHAGDAGAATGCCVLHLFTISQYFR